MNTLRIFRFLVCSWGLILVIGLTLPITLWAQGTGRVTDAETGQALPGASVAVSGTSGGTVTDANGRYVLPLVRTGSVTIEVRFLGYETQTARVSIASGQTVTQNLSLQQATLEGGEVVVLGVRARGQAEALTRQMNASNITNIVASDQMGRFPDASAPEAVQRLPSIAVQRDMGEGRYIQIRGGSSQMTQVTFNGEQVPSPEGSVRQIP